MPVNRITATKRGKAAVAAGVVAAMLSGWGVYTATVPKITPAVVEAGIAKGVVPPAVPMVVSLVKKWEGLVLNSHWDPFGKIYDICYGETRINGQPVKPGMRFTVAECDAIFEKRLVRDFYLPLVRGVKGFVEAPDSVQAALTSGAYNFGVGAAVRSTAARRVGERRYREACAAQTAFNKAGGQIVRGLVLRREMGDAQRIGEAELCLSGLD